MVSSDTNMSECNEDANYNEVKQQPEMVEGGGGGVRTCIMFSFFVSSC